LKVRLLAATSDPELTVALAARLCYSPTDIDGLLEKMDEAETARMIRLLRAAGHLSPFEHASFTVGIQGISRVATHQLVRSRIASYSQQSQRYVSGERFHFIIPPRIAREPELAEEFRRHIEASRKLYRRLLAAGVPGEDARFALPQAVSSNLIMSKNARAWLEWLEARTCQRAQWEIRTLAYRILMVLRGAAPVLFESAGPPCRTRGVCPEGRFSCGRLERERSPDVGRPGE